MENEEIVIFTGLSISFDEAKKILNAKYKAPVKRDDILTLISKVNPPKIIGIIDGVFHKTPAVSHKEIMKAMDIGITVVGGGSMGALRASELDDLGMIGVGQIYKDYKNGTISSDDDVAVSLDPETLEQLSEPLVNIDYNLKLAVEKGIISLNEKKELIEITRSIYYPKRQYSSIFKKSSLETNKKRELNDFIKTCDNLKKLDAIAVLEYIKEKINQIKLN